MKTSDMLLVTIIVEDELESRLVDDLKALGVHGYSVNAVRGEGIHGPRFSEWEGKNVRVETIVDNPIADAICEKLSRDYFPRYAAILYMHPVQVLRPQKFTHKE